MQNYLRQVQAVEALRLHPGLAAWMIRKAKRGCLAAFADLRSGGNFNAMQEYDFSH